MQTFTRELTDKKIKRVAAVFGPEELNISKNRKSGFHKALQENIHRFEAAHGKIEEGEQMPIPLNFGPTGQA